MKSRVSNDQLDMLLDYLLKQPALAKGYGLIGRSKETSDKLWSELATNLNTLGSCKTGTQWKRYWIDLKHKAKSRAAMIRKEQNGSSGGPSQLRPLPDTFKKVLAIIGEEAACGTEKVQFRVPRIPRENPRIKPENWIIELENRRVAAEEKLSEAALMQAEAAMVQAEAAKMQADATKIQAEASKLHATALLQIVNLLMK